MKNIPRVFVGPEIKIGQQIPVSKELSHYLCHVMRCRNCLCFGDGHEYTAMLSDNSKYLVIGVDTKHADVSNDKVLFFAPIKKTEDMINMATQMGIAFLQPVITEHTVVKSLNYNRLQKIIIEACEQSNRNSVPTLLPIKNFTDLDLSGIVYADERMTNATQQKQIPHDVKGVFIGPEGGFSTQEFVAFEKAKTIGISLGKTILRAETAAVVALSRIIE